MRHGRDVGRPGHAATGPGRPGVIEAALAEAGAQMRHVVRTVIYVTDLACRDDIATAHGETFGGIRPASTLVQVVALTPETARVEIEVTAVVTE